MSDHIFTEPERRRVLLACCLAGFVAPLLSTMANLSLTAIGEEFGAGSHELAYVNTAFLLASVIFMVPLCRLADIHGKRLVFQAGLAVVIVGCVLAFLSPSLWWLVACRAIMGAGSAALSSSSISLITDAFPPENRGGALGIQTMCVYVGLAIGPVLGGVLNDAIGWHALFLVVVPIALVAVLCMSTVRFDVAPLGGRPFDSRGAVLYGLGIALAMGGVINLPEMWALAMLAAGLVVVGMFVHSQLRTENYLLNVRLFKSKVFGGSCLAAFLSYAASYSISYFMALYLQSIGAMTATEAGMMMLIQAGIQAFLTPFFGRMSDRVADKRILPTAGMALTAAGVSTFLLYGTELDLALIVVTMVLVGVGNGMFSSPNTSVIMGSVKRSETGEASGVTAVMRQTGMMVSMGIAMMFISIIMGGSDNLVPENYGLFVDVIHVSFAVCLAMCVVGTIASVMRGKETRADRGRSV